MENNAIVLKGTQKFAVDIVNLVERGIQENGANFTEYGKVCVINAMAALISKCKADDVDLSKVDQTTLKVALQNIGFTELNFAATPAEAYFDLRKKDGSYVITIKPQGAGNEKLTRKFGVNVKDLKRAILVREGDEYTLPGFDGEKMTPFTWKPKSLDKKVIMVVYPLLKNDGTYEYLMATREGIKPNLIAQVRQSNLYTFKKPDKSTDVEAREKFYEEVNVAFESMTVDEILADPRWKAELTPTYTSGGSKEQMIIRKMCNNALKNYPREYADSFVANAVKEMWEDKDDSVLEKRPKDIVDVDVVEKVEKEIEEKPKVENAPQDFQVNENGEVEKEKVEVAPKKEQATTKSYEDEI